MKKIAAIMMIVLLFSTTVFAQQKPMSIVEQQKAKDKQAIDALNQKIDKIRKELIAKNKSYRVGVTSVAKYKISEITGFKAPLNLDNKIMMQSSIGEKQFIEFIKRLEAKRKKANEAPKKDNNAKPIVVINPIKKEDPKKIKPAPIVNPIKDIPADNKVVVIDPIKKEEPKKIEPAPIVNPIKDIPADNKVVVIEPAKIEEPKKIEPAPIVNPIKDTPADNKVVVIEPSKIEEPKKIEPAPIVDPIKDNPADNKVVVIEPAKIEEPKNIEPAPIVNPIKDKPADIIADNKVIVPAIVAPIAIDDTAKKEEKPAEPFRPDPKAKAFSWTERNVVTPIKDQKQCGSCWAFATAAVLEASIKLNYNVELDLSEQAIVSCASAGSCGGGNFGAAFDYFQSVGPVSEKTAPYRAQNQPCSQYKLENYLVAAWAYLPQNGAKPTVAEIKAALCKYGPLAAGVYVTDDFLLYTGGIFDEFNPKNTFNHAITIVGWDDDKKAFLIKNSWGTNWGENGFMWIRYDCNNIGCASAWAVVEEN